VLDGVPQQVAQALSLEVEQPLARPAVSREQSIARA
jgi:hypothetical protein